MKQNEFETKWKTEKDTMIDCRIVNVNGEPNIKCPGYIHRANLGDLNILNI